MKKSERVKLFHHTDPQVCMFASAISGCIARITDPRSSVESITVSKASMADYQSRLALLLGDAS